MQAATTIHKQLPLAPRTIPLLPILPLHVRAMLSGRSVGSERQPVVTLPAVVRRILRQPEKISVSKHALKYRKVTDGAHEGQWRHEYAPHTVKIMDTFGESWLRELWFCGVEQSGKTNTMLNCMHWAIDCAPGNIFYLMPTEEAAKNVVGKKIKPMLLHSPKLKNLISSRQDDLTLSSLKLLNGVMILPAHANSATSMATWAAKYCFGDEVDKYPSMAGKEADPITLIKKRNRNYRGRYKRFFCSTPAEKFIYTKGLLQCHQIWEWRVRCPECGELIRMDADHLALADDATPESVELNGCEYVCNGCAVLWTESKREQAIRAGCWIATKGAGAVRPAKVGFHHRSWECLDISLREIAVAYLKSKTGSLAERLDWAHGHEAIDYVHEQRDRAEDFILRLVDPSLQRGVPPSGTNCVLLLVDTQARGFFYQVWACGWGQDMAIAVIDHGFVEEFHHLVELMDRVWTGEDGVGHVARRGWIDSGGGTDPKHQKHSRTAEVYVFCDQNPLFVPIKGLGGVQDPKAQEKEVLEVKTGKGTSRKLSKVLKRYDLRVNLLKDDLNTMLQVELGGPKGISLHAEMDSHYAKQMCAEIREDNGSWTCPRGRANHHWDISVYGLAAILIMGIRTWPRPGEQPQQVQRPQPVQRRRRW